MSGQQEGMGGKHLKISRTVKGGGSRSLLFSRLEPLTLGLQTGKEAEERWKNYNSQKTIKETPHACVGLYLNPVASRAAVLTHALSGQSFRTPCCSKLELVA